MSRDKDGKGQRLLASVGRHIHIKNTRLYNC